MRKSLWFVGAGLVSLVVGVATQASAAPTTSLSFRTVGDNKDVTFNQLLGINDTGTIAGYFGAGTSAKVHPNRGYVVGVPYAQGNFVNQNFPGAAQTQVIGINNFGTTDGFYVDAAGDNFGFVRWHGVWEAVVDTASNDAGTMNQLLGLNNNGLAVGFYADAAGNTHGYRFDFHNDTFLPITVAGATSVTATGINLAGTIVGFYSPASGPTRSFLRLANGATSTFAVSGASMTQTFGINNAGRIVGTYTVGSGDTAKTYGYTRQNQVLSSFSDPNGVGATVANGINSNGTLVGFYTAASGNTDGFVATP
jgi:hypothetical protein